MNRIAIAIAIMAAAGCAGADETQLASSSPATPIAPTPAIPVGVGEVNGLPGTPLELSANGIPIIEGIERPDYSDEGINSFAKRLERRSETNPTGEYQFQLDALGPQEWVADADDRAGFMNGLEEYTWRLTHPNVTHEKGTFTSAVFHGKAFSTNSDGSINALGACWLPQNAGKDCEFPDSKSLTYRLAFGDGAGDSFSHCNQLPPNGTLEPTFYQDPSDWLQEAFNIWSPEVTMTEIVPHTERVTVWCPQSLPGSFFFGVMGASGGDGTTTRRVTNAHDAPGCNGVTPTGAAFPRGMFTYHAGNIEYSADNLYQRALACTTVAMRQDSALLHNASVNMFAHELGHVMGFAHFSTGIMQTGGNCGLFYTQIRVLPQAFHTAMAGFSPNSGTYHFIPPAGTECGPTILPTPSDDSMTFPIGRLWQ